MIYIAYIGIYLLDSRSARPGLHGNDNKGKIRLTTSNNLEHPKIKISPQIQTVAEIFTSNLEHIKEKGGEAPLQYMQRESVLDKRV